MRIVSLLPSATEIVFALGAGPSLVGRSAECDFPPEVRDRPVVMHPRWLDHASSSRQIDARVRGARLSSESLYAVETDILRKLRPDVLLTQDLCGVCSVTGADVAAACSRAGVDPRIISLTPTRLEQVWQSIETIGQAIDRRGAARRLVSRLRRRTGAIVSGRTRASPRVAVVEWLDPPILAGLWTPDLVLAAGGQPVGPRPGEVGLRTQWRAIAALRPDLVILSPCSFAVPRTRVELEGPAIAEGVGQVAGTLGTWLADEAYFSRPGPRLVEGLRLVQDLLRGVPPTSLLPAERWIPQRGEIPA